MMTGICNPLFAGQYNESAKECNHEMKERRKRYFVLSL
jgi:hypothetical protein